MEECERGLCSLGRVYFGEKKKRERERENHRTTVKGKFVVIDGWTVVLFGTGGARKEEEEEDCEAERRSWDAQSVVGSACGEERGIERVIGRRCTWRCEVKEKKNPPLHGVRGSLSFRVKTSQLSDYESSVIVRAREAKDE